MNPDDLVRMANQIAAFFEPYAHEDAVEGTADHLRKFWDPRMRAQIKTLTAEESAAADALSPLAREAVARL